MDAINPAGAKSVAHKPLPPVPQDDSPSQATLVLFYQYVEPMWSKKQHKKALAKVISLAKEHGVTGRGRCAAEGLNCTLTGTAPGTRAFCIGLRAWNKLFDETDFKFTDGLPARQKFKSLSIRKADELVAYGLDGAKAPSIQNHSGIHLEADEYHKMMAKKDNNTVIIDVRNNYESVIGHFNPPEGGAELIDPEMRNSRDFPRWLNLPETQEKLNGKKVMMYCTGGIRCERASALLNQMQEVTPGFKTDGVYELRGGIERYLKTYPEGGHWKGMNYVFDRRMAQVPDEKPREKLEEDKQTLPSRCAACWGQCAEYRGKFKCGGKDCGVPVIVCLTCQRKEPPVQDKDLCCNLCYKGLKARDEASKPDLMKHKRLLAEQCQGQQSQATKKKKVADSASKAEGKKSKKSKGDKDKREQVVAAPSSTSNTTGSCRRIFVGRLPLLVNATKVREALVGEKEATSTMTIQWLTDKNHGHFYGSCFVQMPSAAAAAKVVGRAAKGGDGVTVERKKLKINLAPLRDGEVWPPANHQETERPPVGA